jgi:hypothetical protein
MVRLEAAVQTVDVDAELYEVGVLDEDAVLHLTMYHIGKCPYDGLEHVGQRQMGLKLHMRDASLCDVYYVCEVCERCTRLLYTYPVNDDEK